MIKWARHGNVETPLPKIAHEGDAGYDLPSSVNCKLCYGDQVHIPTGWAVEIPPGWVGIVKSRSGLAVRWGVDVGAGVIDSGYRGEITVVLRRPVSVSILDSTPMAIEVGMRIAQLVVVPHLSEESEEVEAKELSPSHRNLAGYGSTGGWHDGTADTGEIENETPPQRRWTLFGKSL